MLRIHSLGAGALAALMAAHRLGDDDRPAGMRLPGDPAETTGRDPQAMPGRAGNRSRDAALRPIPGLGGDPAWCQSRPPQGGDARGRESAPETGPWSEPRSGRDCGSL